MPSDRLVTTDHVLKSVMEFERRGSTQMMSALEEIEPDLMEFLLESLTRHYHQLTDCGLSGKEARKVYRHAEKTAVVCIMALQKAHHDLWRRDHLDPPTQSSPPPDSPA